MCNDITCSSSASLLQVFDALEYLQRVYNISLSLSPSLSHPPDEGLLAESQEDRSEAITDSQKHLSPPDHAGITADRLVQREQVRPHCQVVPIELLCVCVCVCVLCVWVRVLPTHLDLPD